MVKQLINNGENALSVRNKLNSNSTELYDLALNLQVDTITNSTMYKSTGLEEVGVEYWDADAHTKTLVLEYGVKLQHGLELSVSIARTAGNAGNVVVTTFGVHYEIDSIGSKEITTK